MARQNINNGMTGLAVRTALNENFTELYTSVTGFVSTATYTAGLSAKADASALTAGLSGKVDTGTYTAGLALKADAATVTSALGGKVDTATYTAGLAAKLNITDLFATIAANFLRGELSGSYTLVVADANKYIPIRSAAGVTVTVPTNASAAIPVGSTISIAQKGAGAITIAPSGGVTVDKMSTNTFVTAGTNAVITLVKEATNTWALFGALGAA